MSATAGFSWEQNETFLWKFNTTTAFRAPNIDDIGKIFDSQPGCVVIPNSSLKPEYAYGCELGLNININSSILVDVSGYYTYLDNAITRDFISINGASEIITKVFDKKGLHTRAAISSNSLPLGVAVEVDAIFEIN